LSRPTKNENLSKVELASSLMEALRTLQKAQFDVLAKYELSPSSTAVLHAIYRLGDGAIQITLAKDIGILASTLAHLLDGLEQSGFIRREKKADDRRANTVWLTDSGRAMNNRIVDEMNRLNTTMLAQVNREDIGATLRVVHSLLEQGEKNSVLYFEYSTKKIM